MTVDMMRAPHDAAGFRAPAGTGARGLTLLDDDMHDDAAPAASDQPKALMPLWDAERKRPRPTP